MNKKINQQHRIRFGLKAKLILFFTIIALIPLLILSGVTYSTSFSILEQQMTGSTVELTKQIESSLGYYFGNYMDGTNQFSSDSVVRNIVSNPGLELSLLRNFETYAKAHPDVMNVFIGTEQKNMYIYPGQKLPEGYDPTSRVWYTMAVEKHGVIVTPPYVDASTGIAVVTVASPVYDANNNLVGVIGVDISLTTLRDKLNNIRIGKEGYPLLTAKDLTIVTHIDLGMLGKPMPIQEIIDGVAARPDNGIIEYTYNNSKKIVIYEYMPEIGMYVLSTMYYSDITDKTNTILFTTLALLIASIIFAVAFGTVISGLITKNLKHVVEKLDYVKAGDLTVLAHVKSKDEIGLLAGSLNDTVDGIKTIIREIQGVITNVASSAENLAAAAQETAASADEVTRTAEEIAKGATEQAGESEKGAEMTGNLARQIDQLMKNTNIMLANAGDALDANKAGVLAMATLHSKTKENDESTNKIETAIVELDLKTKQIGDILDTISSIADQTNLLALNASIEAARAGEHGRGFAVVADEIRKLAEDSRRATVEIQVIVTNIQKDSSQTVDIMKEVKIRSAEQSLAVNEASASFESISNQIQEISTKINNINNSVKEIDDEKSSIVTAIGNISSISEETAAASQEVTATMEQQAIAIDEVAKLASDLNELSLSLRSSVSRFKI